MKYGLKESNTYGPGGVEQRNLYNSERLASRKTPDFTGSNFARFITPRVFTGDFEVEIDLSTSSQGISLGISSEKYNNNSLIFISGSDNRLRSSFGDGIEKVTINPINDGKKHIAIVRRIGSTGTILVDGVAEFSGVVSTNTVTFYYTGNVSNNLPFKGQIFSVKYTDKSGAEDVVTDIPLDSGSTLYQNPRGTSLGAELLTSTNDFSNAAWAKGATATVTGTNVINFPAVNDSISQDITINSADKSFTGGIFLSGTGTVHFQLTNLSDDASTYVITLTATPTLYDFVKLFNSTSVANIRFRIYRDTGDTATQVTASNATTKQLPESALLFENFGQENWSDYVLQRNIQHSLGVIPLGWLSDNKVTNGTFDADTDWAKTSNWSIANGVAVGAVKGSVNDYLTQVISLNAGGSYLCGLDVLDALTNFQYILGGTGGNLIPADTESREIIVAGSTDSQIQIKAGWTASGSVDNSFIKHLIEVPQ